VRVFLWLRILTAAVLFALSVTAGGWGGTVPVDRGGGHLLLISAVVFSGLSALGLRWRFPMGLLGMMQVAWDLFFSVAWIYATGGTESLFLFLFLFVVIEASFLLERNGIVLTAFLCALCYGIEIHLEHHHALTPVQSFVPGPETRNAGVYPIAGVIFMLTAIGSTAWLSNNLKERLSRTRLLLQEKSEDMQDLLSLNESIVRCVRSGIVTLDRENRITSVNEAAVLITGYDRAEIVGKCLQEILGAVPPHALKHPDARSAYPSRWEQSVLSKGNQTLCLGCSGAVLRDHNGESFGHLIIFQDLSPYKRIEEELRRAERLAAIGELAAGLAHEIRNPLASLYGSIQLLQGELLLDRNQQRLMRIILQESERLNGLITDFLLFAAPATNQKRQLKLLPVVEEVLDLFQKGPHFHPEIRLEVEVPPDITLFGNEKQMTQILWNLLLNAAQAMSKGCIRIRAVEENDSRGKPVVSVFVQDTGQGISRENISKIFDPFFTSRQEGTGLGLAVVYRIVENHGGQIHVDSVEGEGTVFRIDLPRAEPGQKAEDAPAREPGSKSLERT
jgi:two-component system sensor histidine kinase PilS (NtrC family)